LQETVTKRSADSKEPVDGSVTLCIRSQKYILSGHWTWDMQSNAVYCSDVMDFPHHFEGTKGIIHPDDITNVSAALQVLLDGELSALGFRLITTYGEVKTINGQNVNLEKPEQAGEECLSAPPWEKELETFALRREAEFLQQRQAIAEAAEKLYHIGSFAINKSTGDTWYSDEVYRIYGLPPQSLNQHANTFHSFLHPDDRISFLDAFEAAYTAEVPLHLEFRIQLRGDKIRTLRMVSYWSFNQKGQSIFSGVLRDLSEEVANDGQIRAAGEKLQLHQQVLKFSELSWNTGYWFLDLVTRKITYSDNYYRIYGLKPHTMPMSNTFLNLVHPEDRTAVHNLVEGLYKEHQLPEAEFRIVRPDGRQRLLRQSGKLLTTGERLLMIGVIQDVTVQRGLEKKITELNEKAALQDAIRQITEDLTDTSFVTWTADGHITWSEGFVRQLGYKPDAVEPSARLLHKQIHPDDLKPFKDAEALVTNGQAHDGLQFRIVGRNGERHLHISFHRIGSGAREVVVGIIRDLTREEAIHRKLAEKELYALALNATTNDMILLTDTDNMVLSWNQAAEEKTGIRAAEALYSNLFDLFPSLLDEPFMGRLHTAQVGADVKELKARNLYLRKAHNYYLTPIKNGEGAVVRVLHVVQDVSRELDLQQQLSERLAFIESLVEASVDRIVVLDRHMNYLYWNRKAEEYYAIAKERVIGHNILEVFPGLRNDPGYGEFRKVLKGETIHLPPVLTEDSTEYFEAYLIPVKNEREEVTAILWIVHDLSHELQVQKEQRRASRILETIDELYIELDAAGHFRYINRKAEEMWQKRREDLLGKYIWDVFPHAVNTGGFELIQKALAERVATRGEYFSVVLNKWAYMSAVPTTDGAVILFHDITERKKSEQQLQEQSHYLRRISETVPDMISVMELSSRNIHYLNKETFAMHGFDPDAMLQKTAEERAAMIYEGDRQRLNVYYQQLAVASDDEVMTAEYRARDLSGEWKWFLVRGRVFQRDENGKVTHVLNAIENITARKNAELELIRLKDEMAQKATDKYLNLFNSIDEGFYQAEVVFDEANQPVDILFLEENPAAVRIIGQSFVGKSLKEINRGYENHWFDVGGSVALTGESRRIELYSEPDKKWFNSFITKVGDKNSRLIAIIFQDVTDRKKAEAALQDSNARLVDVLESTTDAFYALDAAFNFTYVNAKAAQLWNRSPESLIGRHYWTEFPNVVGSESYHKHCEAAQTGQPLHYETVSPVLGGWAKVNVYPGKDGGLSVFFHDIAERKRAEKKLKSFAADLEQQVKERTKELQESVAFVQEITHTTPDRITLHEAATTEILYTNHPEFWTELYGNDETYRNAEEKRAVGLVHPDDQEKLNTFLQQRNSLADGEIGEVELRMKGGKWVRIQSKVFKRDTNGAATQIISFTSDITGQKKSALEVQKNLAILQQAEELAQIGSWEYDVATGKFNWSEGMYRLFGLPQGAKVSPETYLNFAAEEDRTVAKRIIKNLTKKLLSFEEIMRIKKGGGERLLKIKGSVVNDEAGKPQRMVGVDLDITDIKAAEEKLKETQHWLEQTALASPDAIVIYEFQNKQPFYLNNCLGNWLGTTSEALVNMGIDGRLNLVHPDDRLRLLHFNERLKAATDTQVLTLEYRLFRHDDTLLWIRNRSKVFQRDVQGNVTHVLGILQDVTEEKAAERVLTALNASLEKKNQELEQKNDEITSFAFVASHDLKEPLRKIHTFGDWILTREEGLSAEGRDHLQRMAGAVKRLHLLIDDILALTKVHVDKEQTKAVDLNLLLQRLKEEQQEKLEETGAVIEAEPLPTITGAENLLFYLFKNLISNGIKFQPAGNRPHIRIHSEKEGSYTKVSFTDNGIGIPEGFHKKIFEMFRRLHGRTEYEGTGMGLAICKKIMEKHGGKITVESGEGKGTTFTCWFP
jgi:PAS domain S-box-containing protein